MAQVLMLNELKVSPSFVMCFERVMERLSSVCSPDHPAPTICPTA